jgi:hypothetical protein
VLFIDIAVKIPELLLFIKLNFGKVTSSFVTELTCPFSSINIFGVVIFSPKSGVVFFCVIVMTGF